MREKGGGGKKGTGKEKDDEKETGWTSEEKTEPRVWQRIAFRHKQKEDNEKGKG